MFHLHSPLFTIQRVGQFWFAVAAFGQLAFIGFIVSYYGSRILNGNYAGWNDKGLITGYVAGDNVGNFMFAAHMLMAAIMTLCGLLQLLPLIRKCLPQLHRMSGRIFIIMACALALGGLWMTWVRGSHLSFISGLSVSLNGLLILLFAPITVYYAIKRRIAQHQRWAIRLFMVSSGVWFFRVGLMGWIIINQGSRGMNATLSGPADIALSFGSYLIPLALSELYFYAKLHPSGAVRFTAAALIVFTTLFMALGIFGTITILWR